MERYRSASQQRVLRVLVVLGGHELEGIAPGDVARALDIAPSAVTHDLANLALAGLAERLDTGRWRLTPRITQIAIALLNGVSRARRKLDEVEQRYTRTPY